MNQFIVLLKKEIGEFLTPQQLVPLVLIVAFFAFIGRIAGSERAREQSEDRADAGVRANQVSSAVAVMDEDGSPLSRWMVEEAFGGPASGRVYPVMPTDAAIRRASEQGKRALVVIPRGFEAGIRAGTRQKVAAYAILRSLSLPAMMRGTLVDSTVGTMNGMLSRRLFEKNAPGLDQGFIESPVFPQENVVIGERRSPVDLGRVMGFVSSQVIFIPIILFMVIIFAAQMIALAMATEQENKTLETLLSAPVNRRTIVAAKLVGAGLVALLFALVYMVGFRYYMDGMSGGAMSASPDSATQAAMRQLGLVFDPVGYVLLGASLFLGILSALAISMILGAFVQEVRNVQAATMPVILLIMIPYLFVLFLDFDRLSPAMRFGIYANPFSHPFLAAQDLLYHRYALVLYGIAYEAVVFVVFVYIAARLFSSDRILTMRINWGKKRAAVGTS